MEKIPGALTSIMSYKSTKYAVVGLITLYLLRQVKNRATRNKVQAILNRIEVVQKERDEHIAWARNEFRAVSEVDRKKIEGMDFRQLQSALQSGEVKAETVMRVYYGLALRSHEKTNCLTTIIKKSLDDARQMDEKAKDPLYVKPRLFGIPLSVKEQIEVEGQRSTWGLVQLIDNIAKEDSYPVMKLRSDGMIPFCTTNVPATCMTYCTSNSIYGTTNTPLDATRTCGGSSGGEGALVGSFGSLIGLGSDIGGSIRIPSAYSGCCGFKPSATRFSTLQYKEPVPLRPVCMPTEGPLAQDPHAITEIMRAVWSDQFLSSNDPLSVPVDFREELFKEGKSYRIGYFTSDGYIDPLPGNQRVVKEAVELLRSKGHELVPFSLDEGMVSKMARAVYCMGWADGGAHTLEILKDEPLSPMMEPIRHFGEIPMWVKKTLGKFYRFRGDGPTADILDSVSNKSIDIQTTLNTVYACRKQLIKKMKDEKIDIILCPPTISPAMPLAMPNQIPFSAIMATMFWNAMDFPAGVVTTSSWSDADEAALDAYPAKGAVEKGIKTGCKGSVGLPLAVQIVALPFRDESVLRVMVDLYDAKEQAKQ